MMSGTNAVASASVAGWDELIDSLRTLPARMLERLPESQRRDPQLQQEVGRLALAALVPSVLDALGGDPDHPVFLPQIGQVLNVGQPNADTVYRMSRVSSEGVYRLSGRRGSLRMLNISQSPPNPGEAGFTPEKGVRTMHSFNDLEVDEHGSFSVILSAKRPAGYRGDWWKLESTTNKLLLRMVSSDWGNEEEPALSIERIDGPVTRPRIAAADLEARLRQLPRAIDFMALMFVGHVEKLRQQGLINALRVYDLSQTGGLASQFYYEGTYELADDEALLVEVEAPTQSVYRSLILTNPLYETTDWLNNHSSLNDSQAEVDADGVLRIVVSARDPGVPNWMDTAGHRIGLIQGRWTECNSQPIPTVRKIPLAEVRSCLPPETPAVSPVEREEIIRKRRAALQRRTLW